MVKSTPSLCRICFSNFYNIFKRELLKIILEQSNVQTSITDGFEERQLTKDQLELIETGRQDSTSTATVTVTIYTTTEFR